MECPPTFIVIGLILDVFHVLPRSLWILGIKLYLFKSYVCTFVYNIHTLRLCYYKEPKRVLIAHKEILLTREPDENGLYQI